MHKVNFDVFGVEGFELMTHEMQPWVYVVSFYIQRLIH